MCSRRAGVCYSAEYTGGMAMRKRVDLARRENSDGLQGWPGARHRQDGQLGLSPAFHWGLPDEWGS